MFHVKRSVAKTRVISRGTCLDLVVFPVKHHMSIVAFPVKRLRVSGSPFRTTCRRYVSRETSRDNATRRPAEGAFSMKRQDAWLAAIPKVQGMFPVKRGAIGSLPTVNGECFP
jgi:hypothetical protein